MDTLITSTVTVALAEIGDKTQLLSLLLAARFANKTALILGILVATIINHGLSAWLGDYLAGSFTSEYLPWIVNGCFIVVGLWLLIPDKDEERSEERRVGKECRYRWSRYRLNNR